MLLSYNVKHKNILFSETMMVHWPAQVLDVVKGTFIKIFFLQYKA